MTDIWVCSTCHSVNRQRNDRCYKCGAKRAEADAGVMGDTRAKLALQQRTAIPYRSSMLRALIAAGFILAVATLNLIVLVVSFRATQVVREQIPLVVGGADIDSGALFAAALPSAVLNVVLQVVSLIALLSFSAWLSRVVANIPALGGGIPRSTPTRAFIYPWIPIVNLIKVPPIIQDALYRLDPRAGGLFMILLAWVGLVGSAIVRFVFDFWQRLRFESIIRNAQTEEQFVDEFTQAFDLGVLVSTVTTLMISAGAVILVVVMLRIEARARARDHEIRAAATGGSGRATTPGRPAEPSSEGPVTPVASPVVAATTAAATVPPVTEPGWSATASPAPAAIPLVVAGSASPVATGPAGPRLGVTVLPDRITAWVDESPAEPSSLEELRAAAPALAAAHGSAIVTAAPGADPATVGAIVDALRAAGVPTRQH